MVFVFCDAHRYMFDSLGNLTGSLHIQDTCVLKRGNDMLNSRWNKGLARLDVFVAREKHAAVPDYYVESGFRLGTWVSELHSMYNHWNSLSREQIGLLEQLEGWQWCWKDLYFSEHNPYPGAHLEPRRVFREMSVSERAAIAYDGLAGLGIPDRTQAVKYVADNAGLPAGLNDYDSFFDDHELFDLVNGAIDAGLDFGYLDEPKANTVRAVLPTPEDFATEDWAMCLLSALLDKPLSPDELVSRATAWAKENCGLRCEELGEVGKVRSCLKDVIQIDIGRSSIEELAGGMLRLCC